MKNQRNSNFILQSTWQLFLVFMLLKMMGHIDWSWWLVTLPISIPIIGTGLYILYVYIRTKRVARAATKDQLKKAGVAK